MLYKRSSFLKWLENTHDCKIDVLPRGGLRVKYGFEHFHMITNKKDLIDYEEIFICCNRLGLIGLPGNKDLEPVE